MPGASAASLRVGGTAVLLLGVIACGPGGGPTQPGEAGTGSEGTADTAASSDGADSTGPAVEPVYRCFELVELPAIAPSFGRDVVVDLDGDGLDELVLGREGGTSSVQVMGAAAISGPWEPRLQLEPFSLRSGYDQDLDGYGDLVVRNADGEDQWWRGQPDGSLVEDGPVEPVPGVWQYQALRRAVGEPVRLAGISDGGTQVLTLLDSGSGPTVVDMLSTPMAGQIYDTMTTLDDGVTVAFNVVTECLGFCPEGLVVVLVGDDGSLTYVDWHPTLVGIFLEAAHDVDGDGDLDLFIDDFDGIQIVLAPFDREEIVPLDEGRGSVGDIDGDGFPDLVVRAAPDGPTGVRWGVADEISWLPAEVLPTMPDGSDILVQHILDIDGDGHRELLGAPLEQLERWAILDPVPCEPEGG